MALTIYLSLISPGNYVDSANKTFVTKAHVYKEVVRIYVQSSSKKSDIDMQGQVFLIFGGSGETGKRVLEQLLDW